MDKFNLKLSQKLRLGFGLIIVIFAINVVLSLYTSNESRKIIERNAEIVNPSLNAINEFILLVTNSKMYTTNWLYLSGNEQDKQSLRQIHNIEYPLLNERLNKLKAFWDREQIETAQMDSVMSDFEDLMGVQKSVMQTLVSFEDYEDFFKRSKANSMIDDKALPMANDIINKLNTIAAKKRQEVAKAEEELTGSFDSLQWIIITLGIVVVVVANLISYFTIRSIIKPISKIKELIRMMSEGKLPEVQEEEFSKDEIGDMGRSVETLAGSLRQTSDFAQNIGNGNLNAEFEPQSEDDMLGNSLLAMRLNLRQVAEDDSKRNWTTEGVAKFSEILRDNNNNIGQLADEVIQSLVKYTDSNQGGLFIIADEQEDGEDYMYLAGCYAWDRKKHIDMKIFKGEGLAGQVWQEGDTVYITDVPQDYVMISSGLGEANPRSVLIVPLKVNDEIYGVVEMASFEDMPAYKRQFIEKIGESIASTISMVKINAKTAVLLEESQMMTEQMRAQEEEMRQNMEELQATQEEMEKGESIIQQREEVLQENSIVMELDTAGKIISMNDKLADLLGIGRFDPEGKPVSRYLSDDNEIGDLKNYLSQEQPWSGRSAFQGKRRQCSGDERLRRLYRRKRNQTHGHHPHRRNRNGRNGCLIS